MKNHLNKIINFLSIFTLIVCATAVYLRTTSAADQPYVFVQPIQSEPTILHGLPTNAKLLHSYELKNDPTLNYSLQSLSENDSSLRTANEAAFAFNNIKDSLYLVNNAGALMLEEYFYDSVEDANVAKQLLLDSFILREEGIPTFSMELIPITEEETGVKHIGTEEFVPLEDGTMTYEGIYHFVGQQGTKVLLLSGNGSATNELESLFLNVARGIADSNPVEQAPTAVSLQTTFLKEDRLSLLFIGIGFVALIILSINSMRHIFARRMG